VLAWTALAGAPGIAADQATAARDEEFIAIQGLIDHDLRTPAKHLKDDFAAANYPADQWCRDAIDWLYADRFRTTEPDPAEQKRLSDLYTTVGAKIQTAVDGNAPDLPEVVKNLWKAKGSPLLRLVNDLGRQINPNLPPPITGKASISAQDKASRNAMVAALCAEAKKDFQKGSDAVTAFDNGPGKDLWNIPESSPKYKTLSEQAAMVRFDAIKPLYQAHIILREVLTRGDEFGIDPAPVKNFYTDLFTKDVVEAIGKWDYDWGDAYLPLKAYTNVVLGEAVRQGIKGVNPEDLETEISKVIDQNPNVFSGATRNGFVAMQLGMLQHLMRWRLELGGPKNLSRGLDVAGQVTDRVKNDPTLKLRADDERAVALAQCYVMAARLCAARNDQGGVGSWLGPVMGAKENPMSANAKLWSVNLTGRGGGNGSDWAQAPSPEDPGQALETAKAYISQAAGTPDAHLARGFYLKAAVSLRNAVLGLATPAYEDQFADIGPEVYEQYASTLYHLDMRYHAALVSEEGLRLLANKVTDKSNPWKGKDPVKLLVRNGIIYAQGLLSRATGTAVGHIYDDTITLVKKVSPEDSGKNLDLIQIHLDIQQKHYDDALKHLDVFAKAYPEDRFVVFDLRLGALESRYEDIAATLATNPGAKDDADKAAKAVTDVANGMLKDLDEAAKAHTPTDPELKARRSAEMVWISQAFIAGKYKEVIDQLGADYWKHPPGDEDLAARMMKTLCNATYKFHDQTFSADPAKKDPAKAIEANWPIYQGVYAIYRDHLPNFHATDSQKTLRDAGRLLGAVFVAVSNLGEPQRGADAALAPILDQSKKATADLIAPTLSATSKPGQLVAVGDLLYGMDDHAGAGRLYGFYLTSLDNDSDLQAFVQGPKARLDLVEGLVGTRPELKAEWAKLRDRLEDQPHPGVERAEWGEEPINYGVANKLLKDFKAHVAQLKTVLGADLGKQIDDALAGLDHVVQQLAQQVRVKGRLAAIYRETGRSEEARKLYDELISYDPDDPEFRVAYIENVIFDFKKGNPVPKDQLDKARITAAGLRDDAGTDVAMYWTAWIQVLELSFALDDMATVNNALHHVTASRNDVSQDLVMPAVRPDKRITGDDKRVRRAKNALAATLAQRFLDLYKPEVKEKPLFRIDTVTVDGKDWVLFVDIDAPPMVGTPTTNEEGVDVVVFRPKDDPVEAPQGAAAPPAATGTGAASAPAPATAAAPAPGVEATPAAAKGGAQ
jgi:tetratricopeptide (TPR) repeat protein